MTPASGVPIPHDREVYPRFLWWDHFWDLLILAVLTFGLALPLLVAWFFVGSWWVRRYMEESESVLEEKQLRLKRGVWWRSITYIPLERIIDVTQRQGPVDRHFGVWSLDVVTAGERGSGGSLHGISEIERVRDMILDARDRLKSSAK